MLALVVAWLAIGGIGGPRTGELSSVQTNDASAFLPEGAESSVAAKEQKPYQSSNGLPMFVVLVKESGFGGQDLAAVQRFASGLPQVELAPGHRLSQYLEPGPIKGIPNGKDAKAVLVPVMLQSEDSAGTIEGESPIQLAAEAVKERAKSQLGGLGITSEIGGPAGYVADFSVAFAGIDGLLLGVALAVVFVILLIVYRSPLLPIAVLVTAVFGLALAVLIVYPLADSGLLELSGQSQGILFILVVGAATDYALLLVSRYREELHDHERPYDAMKIAVRQSAEPIIASGATVALGLLCLLLADLGNTSGLGPVGAIGIVGAIAAALTFLPAVLVLAGRKIFWPAIPRVDHHHREEQVLSGHGIWSRISHLVRDHARPLWIGVGVLLIAAAAFVPTFKADGLAQRDFFRTEVSSVRAEDAIGKYFPAGLGSPATMLVPQDKVSDVQKALGSIDGVERPTPASPPKNGKVLMQAVLDNPPESKQARDTLTEIRGALDRVDRGINVGGPTANAVDTKAGSDHDLRTVMPAILLVVLLVLGLLLRSIVAPLVLLVANLLSFAATIGISALVFNHLLGLPGSDASIPLYAFVFLVALGVDYSIFLMTRVREESTRRGTRKGVLVGLAVTGGVITSAGIVLAATFSALVVLPLLFLLQVAFIVAFGVLLDTLVVRSLLVPAIAHDLGRHTWWPSRLSRRETEAAALENDAR